MLAPSERHEILRVWPHSVSISPDTILAHSEKRHPSSYDWTEPSSGCLQPDSPTSSPPSEPTPRSRPSAAGPKLTEVAPRRWCRIRGVVHRQKAGPRKKKGRGQGADTRPVDSVGVSRHLDSTTSFLAFSGSPTCSPSKFRCSSSWTSILTTFLPLNRPASTASDSGSSM